MSLDPKKLEEIFSTPFKDTGENYTGLCPVHNEKSPSFNIHKDKYLVHCFGCGASGGLVNFVKSYMDVDEKEATKLLGLTLEDQVDWFFHQIIPPKPTTFRESYLAPFKKEIHKYVIHRGLSFDTLSKAEALYDHHSQRQVFPHRDREGRLVGAIGRACRNREPKWWFYWGYEKSRYLYRAPTTNDCELVWIVEGVFDALWLYQHGINAVATLGSKPTATQIQEIKDNYRTVVLGYDNDASGIEGSRYLYSQLKNTTRCLFPQWENDENDVMDVEDPQNIDLWNPVQSQLPRHVFRTTVRPSDRSSRVLSQ